MGPSHDILLLLAVLFIATAFSSFTLIMADETKENKDENLPVPQPLTDNTVAQADSKEKRSQEEIMFGNQQNKPNGLVDDLMEIAESAEDNSSSSAEKKSTILPEGEAVNDIQVLSGIPNEDEEQNDVSGAEHWYESLPMTPKAMQYLSNEQVPKTRSPEDFTNSLYDQEDLYRRKRQILERPLPLRKRSLRSSLGQMIQKKGIRLPRRSMRLKRQVDVQDLLNAFGNARYLEDENTVVPSSFSGRAQTIHKRRVPSRYGGYPETPEFRYPYVFQHRDDGVLANYNDVEGTTTDEVDNIDMNDVDSYMLMPPNARPTYSDLGLLPYRTRQDENEAVQKWLSRHTTPSVFRVSRRSSPYFYPIDYRYVSGMKKRSRFSGPPINRLSGEEDSNSGSEFGKWGHVVQVPEAYASPEDIVRLYGLANLLAEGSDEIDPRVRRAA